MTFADELERLHEAATSPPWDALNGNSTIYTSSRHPTGRRALGTMCGHGTTCDDDANNARLAVDLRNATPALIAVLRRAEAAVRAHAEEGTRGTEAPAMDALRAALADLEVGDGA